MATRDLTTLVANALDDEGLTVFFAVELLFDTTPIRLWTGYSDVTLDGNTYIGAGNLLDISSIEETTEIAVRGATITLSGVDSNVVSLALQSPYQGRICNIYFGVGDGVLDGGKWTSISQIFSGYMDEMNIDEGPDYATIELKVENKLIDLERKRVSRYTSAYQKSKYPNDKGFDFVESIQGKQTLWRNDE